MGKKCCRFLRGGIIKGYFSAFERGKKLAVLSTVKHDPAILARNDCDKRIFWSVCWE